ncbi:MAG: hypothetical protein M1440_04865 [Gammaproteobacteria bacterium]|nr:hypothetical protein [Gammaproteobacteria bacterium]
MLQRKGLAIGRVGLPSKALTLLSAPPGFGKTQLLSQWRNEWLELGGLVIWLSLDEFDVPLKFAQGLAVAKTVGCMQQGMKSDSAHLISQDTDELGQLTSWLAALAGIQSSTTE